MEQRPLGRSGAAVSVIGFGAWGIGGFTPDATSYGETDDDASRRALQAALERGVTFFDTAPAYGDGHSEELIGEALEGQRVAAVIATKGGRRRFSEPADFTITALRRTLSESLRRLRTDHVDLYQLHSPPDAVLNAPHEIIGLVRALRDDGIIRGFGVSVRRPEDGLAALDRFELDAIQVNFSLVDQRALDCGLMDAASAHGVALIARTPLCYGLLSGAYDAGTRFDPKDHRSQWPAEQIARWADAARTFADCVAAGTSQTPAQVALRYCLSFPAVAAAIPGMMRAAEVTENTIATRLGPLDNDALATIRAIYQTESFFIARQAPGS